MEREAKAGWARPAVLWMAASSGASPAGPRPPAGNEAPDRVGRQARLPESVYIRQRRDETSS